MKNKSLIFVFLLINYLCVSGQIKYIECKPVSILIADKDSMRCVFFFAAKFAQVDHRIFMFTKKIDVLDKNEKQVKAPDKVTSRLNLEYLVVEGVQNPVIEISIENKKKFFENQSASILIHFDSVINKVLEITITFSFNKNIFKKLSKELHVALPLTSVTEGIVHPLIDSISPLVIKSKSRERDSITMAEENKLIKEKQVKEQKDFEIMKDKQPDFDKGLGPQVDAAINELKQIDASLQATAADNVQPLLKLRERIISSDKNIDGFKKTVASQILAFNNFVSAVNLSIYRKYNNSEMFLGVAKDAKQKVNALINIQYSLVSNADPLIRSLKNNPKISMKQLDETVEGKIYRSVIPDLQNLEDKIQFIASGINLLEEKIKIQTKVQTQGTHICDSLLSLYDNEVDSIKSLESGIADAKAHYKSKLTEFRNVLKVSTLEIIDNSIGELENDQLPKIKENMKEAGQQLNQIECSPNKFPIIPVTILAVVLLIASGYAVYKKYKKKRLEDQIKFLN